ncbi:hypothetical protein V2J09_019766 [Rumex salicifolius]
MSKSSANSSSTMNKATNGSSVQVTNRSKLATKRSVTPNSRTHQHSNSTAETETKQRHRSVTPISTTHSGNGNGHSNDGGGGGEVVVKHAPAGSKRSSTPLSRADSIIAHDPEPGRVRVAIRLRPRNAEDLASESDYSDCVELQPELKKLKLRKNNWSSESYRFDEVFTETASQKRVYEGVAKPSVLSGYNGTIMAYGQTGTGKTFTVGNVGTNDTSERGIMVRALEDILSSTSPEHDIVEFSFLQLYMESVQDLLSPEKVNIPIVEDSKTGEVSVPGAEVVQIQDLDHFMLLLQRGDSNRHAANTKMNTNSSRSHAILMVNVRRSVAGKPDKENGASGLRTIRKSKLLIVDLAGSERVNKSGSEGQLLEEAKFINLSLTSLGKCINALAENSPHIPTRESKLTRLLRDSFGGSARTSLIITVGPSARNHAETMSTIMFGQRAMKIVNMVKMKEEFDYESLCRKLESKVDNLTKEIDRQQKLRDKYINEMEKKLKECQHSFAEAEKSLVARSEMVEKENSRLEKQVEIVITDLNNQKDCNKLLRDEVARLEMSLEHFKQKQQENSTYQKALADTTQMYEKQIQELIMQLENERGRCEGAERQLDAMKKLLSDHERSIQEHQVEYSSSQKVLADTTQTFENKITELLNEVEEERAQCRNAEEQIVSLRKLLSDQNSVQKEEESVISELRTQLEEINYKEQADAAELKKRLKEKDLTHEITLKELESLRTEYMNLVHEKEKFKGDLDMVRDKMLSEEKQKVMLESEIVKLKKLVQEYNEDVEVKKLYVKQHTSRGSSSFRSAAIGLHRSTSGQMTAGFDKVLSMLSSDDIVNQMHAVKVVANLAAEDANQEKIVNEGGLDALLMILQTSQNTAILRVASGAIANLAMNEMNQGLIMSKRGAELLANTTLKTDDPQTLRMVAGAIANLCGNVKLHTTLRDEGCIKALLGMARSKNTEVVAQVARGLANFAKCETREVIQGHKRGASLLTNEGAITWLIDNSKANTSDSSQRHIELALCHLAQNEDNSQDFISSGGLKEVVRISTKSAREDIRNLATRTLNLNRTFQAQLSLDAAGVLEKKNTEDV